MCAMALPQAGSLTQFRTRQTAAGLTALPHYQRSNRCSLQIRCAAQRPNKDADSQQQKSSRLVAAHLAAALAASVALGGAIFPEEALAARSGGRVGGSSGFRSAPAPRAAPRASPGPSRQQNNYYNYSAPPLTGGYGYGRPFGYGGFGGINVFPSFGVPVFGLGSGFFNLIIIAVVFSTVAGVVRSLLGGRRRDDFDDFD